MADQDIPRREHPRPEFHRGTREGRDFVNLNGWWSFEFDPDDVGENEGWQEPGGRELAGEILVPFGWESHMAWGDEGLADNEDYFSKKAFLDPDSVSLENCRKAPRHETGWYSRTFKVPRRWREERVWLRIEAVDYFIKIWVNGALVCDTESGYTPIAVDVTDHIDPKSENTLTIRVDDPNDHGDQPVGKQWGWYARTSGIWQTVWLEPRPATFIESVKFETDIESGEAVCKVTLSDAAPEGAGLRLAVQMPDGATAYNTWGPEDGDGPHCTTLRAEEPRLWCPDDPYLYHCTIELLDGTETSDLVYTYFAFREVTIQPLPGKATQYLHLNGRPLYLLGALDQSFNPWGVYTFRSDDEVRADVRLAKELGFNFLRIHIKAEEPRFHYWADHHGLLVMADMPNVGYESKSELGRQRWERTARAIVERDAGHPSIISWCLFNETWGLGGHGFKEDRETQEWVESMYRLAEQLDPTRPIEDNSPCLYDHVKTDINSWHFYLNDYAKAKAHIANVVEQTKPGSEFNYCPGWKQGDEPLINSEYGGISARMGDLDVSWCFRFLTNELRLHEKIGGYVYTELQDIEWERNGLLNYDRTRKELGYDPRDMNSLDFIALDAPPCVVVEPGERVEIPVRLSHFSDYAGDTAKLTWRMELTDHTAATEVVRSSDPLRLDFPRWAVTPAEAMAVIMPPRPGLVTVHFHLTGSEGENLAHNWLHFHVVGGLPQDVMPIPVSTFEGNGAESSFVDGEVEAVWVEGGGALSTTVDVPDGVTSARLLAELSACRPGGGGKQTDDDKWPSRVTVSVGGMELETIDLADHPADGRGVLSHHYGFEGRYGWLVPVDLPGKALDKLRTGEKLRISAEGNLAGGLCVYGAKAGRVPAGPRLLLERG